MKHSICAIGVVFYILLATGSTFAQDAETVYVFGEYYVCDQNREAWSDTISEEVFGPIFDAQVDEGRLLGWGTLGHYAGGEWRRVQYYASNDLDKLLAARSTIIGKAQNEVADASREFNSICPDHDDYIWASVDGSASLGELLGKRAEAGYSTYYVCDIANQERADEIVKQLYGPLLNEMVEAGELNSWAWYAHLLGGKYRRLMSVDGADYPSLIKAIDKYASTAQEKNASLSNEFQTICHSHEDYLWDIILDRP